MRIGDLPDSSLIATRFGAVRRVVCASPAYLAVRMPPATPQDVVAHDIISFGNVSAQDAWSFWSEGAEIVVPFKSRLSVSTIDAAIDAGLAGAGLLRAMSYQMADAVRSERLQLFSSPTSRRRGRCTLSTIDGTGGRSSFALS